MRDSGMDVHTMSIHRAADDTLLTNDEKAEAAGTFAVLPISPARLAARHARSVFRSPARYLRTLTRALQLSSPGLRAHLWQFFYFAEAIVVHDHCERVGVRHVHAQFADVATDVALLVTERGGAGWSWSLAVHGPVEFYDVQRNRLPQKVAAATFVRTISHFGRSQVLTLLDEEHWDKVHTIRAGLDLASYPAAEHPPPGEELRVLCVGRLIRFKGQSLLVKAVATLRARGIPVRLILIGDGPTHGRLAQLVAQLGLRESVELLGAVGQASLPSQYAAADVFCLPSFAEGLPVVLMEAMATERPVVTTSVMGIGELVTDGVSGLLVPPASLTDLVDALATLADDPHRRARMGRAGREKIVAEYDVRRTAAELRQIFEASSAGAG